MLVRESPIRDALRLLVWYPARWMIEAVPAAMGTRLISALGDLHFMLSGRKRRHLKNNLRRMFPDGLDDKRTDEIVLGYLRNHYLNQLMIFVFPKLTAESVREIVEFEGLEKLDAALAKKKGVMLVHGHFGPAHLPLVALALLGYPMKQIGLPSDDGLSWIGKNVAFRLRMKYEAMMPAEIIKADGFLRAAFRWLGDNGVIMITGDGSGTEKLVGRQEKMTMHGASVMIPLGPATLAEKTGAALVPMFIVPGENRNCRIIIDDQIASDKTGEEKIIDMTRQFVEKLEKHERNHPGYMHFLDRFEPGKIIVE